MVYTHASQCKILKAESMHAVHEESLLKPGFLGPTLEVLIP